MTSELAIYAARLRDYIDICVGEFAAGAGELGPAPQAHYDAEFNAMALVLFSLQFSHNPPYRKFCEARKILPNAVTHWLQIPALPTAAFKELELTCLPAEERTIVFHSSGTTEQRPSRHVHSRESLAVYEASLWPWFAWQVLPEAACQVPGARCQVNDDTSHFAPLTSHLTPDTQHLTPDTPRLTILTPSPARAPHSSLVHMFETVRRRLGAPGMAFVGTVGAGNTWDLEFDAVVTALRAAVGDHRPLVLLGTAFSFVHLLDHLAANGLQFNLPAGSRVMETGGYKGRSRQMPKPALHSLIVERLGVPADHIVCEYGMCELSSQAYDNRVSDAGCQVSGEERGFRFPPWVRTCVMSPETGLEVAEGETGLLRVVDLANVYSVLAIQTEDLAVRRRGGFELLGRAESAESRGCSLLTRDA